MEKSYMSSSTYILHKPHRGLAPAPGYLSALPRAALGMQLGQRQSTPCSIEAAKTEVLSDFAISGRSSSELTQPAKLIWDTTYAPKPLCLSKPRRKSLANAGHVEQSELDELPLVRGPTIFQASLPAQRAPLSRSLPHCLHSATEQQPVPLRSSKRDSDVAETSAERLGLGSSAAAASQCAATQQHDQGRRG